jgi:hypothetical protein
MAQSFLVRREALGCLANAITYGGQWVYSKLIDLGAGQAFEAQLEVVDPGMILIGLKGISALGIQR